MAVLRLADGELCYELAGSARPGIVFVHGGYCTHRDWVNQLEALQDNYTVVAFDMRGHGSSPGDLAAFSIEQAAHDVHHLIDGLRLGPSVVVGHSMGARVALQAAADRPENVLGIGLLDGMRLPKERPAGPPMSEETFRAYMVASFEALLSEKTAPLLRDELIDRIKATDTPTQLAYFGAIDHWDRERMDEVLDTIGDRTPALIVQSTYQDEVTHQTLPLGPSTPSTPWLDLLATCLPRAEIQIAAGLSHFQMLEEPELITDSIRRFAEAVR